MGIVREMGLSDLDQIMVLENQHQLHPWPRDAFVQAMRLGQYCCVYEERGHTAEYIWAYGVADKGHGRTICATSLDGADAIYHAWFSHSRSIGASLLQAEIEPDNRAARIRLKRYGFELVGTVPGFYGPGTEAQVWQRTTPQGISQEIKTEQDVQPSAESA